MKLPNIEVGQVIRVEGNDMCLITRVFSEEEKKDGLCSDAQVVYYQNEIKGIKEDVVWNGEEWKFKSQDLSGAYVNIDLYPELKK